MEEVAMKAAIYYGAGDVRCGEVPDPKIQEPTDVILRTRTTSICGSDLYIYNGQMDTIVKKGHTTLGHEIVGVVEEVGKEVTRFKKGDRVTFPYSVSCGYCYFCRLGQTAHCSTSQKAIYGYGVAFGDLGGSQAQYVRVPMADAHLEHVPESISDEQGLFLSCNLPAALFAIESGQIQPGDQVVVLGCGPTGLLVLQLAAQLSPAKLIAIDAIPHRLERARELGATHVLNFEKENVVERVMELTEGRGADVVLEVAGQGPAFKTALSLARPGGTISGIGVYVEQDFGISLFDMYFKNLTIRLNGFANAKMRMWRAAQLIERGKIDPSRLLSHTFSLEEVDKAYKTFATRSDGALKMLIRP
jgi:alcohol dehydrogenase